ncbi:hypothetical protein PTTG_01489 [Puccinia triticina 1-1 BBBD Race 1]|uniref:ASD2 domain-containing protein n=1 Tax=Puccinia triticina (isolate 1-1 / race 1 (BBBD)) TaxID=630390 RepID=A0A180H4D2_PUCT1|nr:hypothetical protein PTTG_01489 [Puccinia triticina 1-1 BBBD Race 1]WAR60428.1 hypothetical protein PtB15_9B367 [Puccinia triticina]
MLCFMQQWLIYFMMGVPISSYNSDCASPSSVFRPTMNLQTTTSFSPLHIRSAETPPKPEKVITPGRELTREERKVARRRNGPMDVLPSYAGKRLTFTLPPATGPKFGQLNQPDAIPSDKRTQSNHSSASNTPSTSKIPQPQRVLQSPLTREISLAELIKPRPEPPGPNTSKKAKGKIITGKENAQPTSPDHGNLPSSASIKSSINKPIIPISDIRVSKASGRSRKSLHVVQRKKERSEPSCDSDATPTVLNTPKTSPRNSSDSDKMKTLAAKIFTPGVSRKEAKSSQRTAETSRKTDINLLFDQPTTSRQALKAGKDLVQESQQDPGEEQIYIVADRLLRQDDSLEKSIEDGEELSLETQRLLLKIKSQLNPPDIISISVRKLIEDELEKVDRRLLLLSDHRERADGDEEEEEEDERAEAEGEQAALQSFLENFKTEMLEYSDQLVRYGLLKVKLQRLQTLETNLQSQLPSAPSHEPPAKRKKIKKKHGPK